MNSIEIKLDSQVVFLQMIDYLKSGEKILVDALERAVESELKSEFMSIFQSSLKKDVEIKIHKNYFKNRSASTLELAEKGYDTWYTSINLCCEKESARIEQIEVIPIGFNLESLQYGGGVKRKIKLKKKQLKTQVNYILEFLHVELPPKFFAELDISVFDEGKKLVLCNLNVEPQMSDLEVVSFTDAQSGEKYFCHCARKYHNHIIARCDEIKAQYSEDAWPYKLQALLSNAEYRTGVCHICIAEEKGIDEAKTKYGDGILFNQRPYICQTAFDHNLTKTTSLADVRFKLGISKWKNEALLYSIVKSIFVGCMVEREYSPSWLGRQRIDIFVPDKNLAIEYQGEQHFSPVSIFGGEASFEKGKERDKQKFEKCNENKVTLVYFNFNEPLTNDYIKKKLKKYLDSSNITD